MIRKKSKHNTLCNIVSEHLKNKLDTNNESFYDIIKQEEKYKLHKISTKTLKRIEGECDVVGIKLGRKHYAVIFEVKCSNHYQKALRQLKKDQEYYQKKYELDKIYHFYTTGNPKDKTWKQVKYKWVNQEEINNTKIQY